MATYSILVTSSPVSSDSARQVAEFCRSLYQAKHSVQQIFFYQDGIYHANNLMMPPSDESNPHQIWKDLHQELQIPLIVCVTAAVRRGVISDTEAKSIGVSSNNLTPPFVDTGLGEFFSQLHESDHLVQF